MDSGFEVFIPQDSAPSYLENPASKFSDEGITNGPSIFAYLVFDPGEKPARRIQEARKAQHTDLE
jgi:hypothetical protein